MLAIQIPTRYNPHKNIPFGKNKKRKKEDIKNRRMKNVVVFHHENSSIPHHGFFLQECT